MLTKMIIEIRTMTLDITHRWLDFYCTEFWTFLELGVNMFRVYKSYVFEDIILLRKKAPILSYLLDSELNSKLAPWTMEIVEIVSLYF